MCKGWPGVLVQWCDTVHTSWQRSPVRSLCPSVVAQLCWVLSECEHIQFTASYQTFTIAYTRSLMLLWEHVTFLALRRFSHDKRWGKDSKCMWDTSNSSNQVYSSCNQTWYGGGPKKSKVRQLTEGRNKPNTAIHTVCTILLLQTFRGGGQRYGYICRNLLL